MKTLFIAVLGLLLSNQTWAIEVISPTATTLTNESLITPTITSGTQVGNWTGATIIKESGATVDPDVITDTVGIGLIDDQAGAGNVGMGLWVQQAGAGDNFGISVDASGGVYFIVGNRSGASTMSPFIQYDSVGSLALGTRGSGGGGAAGTTPAFIYNESSGKVGIFESAPNGQVDIAALAARKPTDPLVQVSSQNATGVFTINVNGDSDQAGSETVRSSSTINGALKVTGAIDTVVNFASTTLTSTAFANSAGVYSAITASTMAMTVQATTALVNVCVNSNSLCNIVGGDSCRVLLIEDGVRKQEWHAVSTTRVFVHACWQRQVSAGVHTWSLMGTTDSAAGTFTIPSLTGALDSREFYAVEMR